MNGAAVEIETDYSVCSWRFRSAITLEGAPLWLPSARAAVDVELKLGPVPPVECAEPVGVIVNGPAHATVVAAGIGRFLVSNGRSITADILPTAQPGPVETMILGPVLGALSYQRGIVSLHSNAILVHGRVVALSGRSGAGKSSLAAVLIQRGHRLISDDVLPVLKTPDGCWGLPSNQNLRLWGTTLEFLGQPKDGLRRAADGEREKYFLSSPEKTARSWPLAALVWLESGIAETEALNLQSGPRRARTIFKAAYRQHLAKDFARLGHDAIIDLSMPGVKVYEFLRPRGLERLQRHADMIEALVTRPPAWPDSAQRAVDGFA